MRTKNIYAALALLLWCSIVWAQQVPLVSQDRVEGYDVSQGLVSWYLILPQLGGGNTWYDLVAGQKSTLTNITAGFGWQPTQRSGWWGELKFDGADDYAVGTTNTFYDFLNATFTVSVRYKASTAGYIVAKRTAGGNSGGWFLRVDAGGFLTARVVDNGNAAAGQRTTVSTNHLDGAWRVATVVFTTDSGVLANNDVTIYINGLLDQGVRFDNGATGNIACVCPLTFGAESDFAVGSFLTGSVDDIRIWRRGLSLTEIVAVAQTEPPKTSMMFERSWVLNALSGAVAGSPRLRRILLLD